MEPVRASRSRPGCARPASAGTRSCAARAVRARPSALGVILEQLLLGTGLRIVVLDPNADFVRLGEARPDAPEEAAQQLGKSDIHVLGADSTAAEPLRMRFATMPQRPRPPYSDSTRSPTAASTTTSST